MAGHGHVTPNPDGSKARCGGPGICPVCNMERARLEDDARRRRVDNQAERLGEYRALLKLGVRLIDVRSEAGAAWAASAQDLLERDS
mgnify:FL=1